MTFKLSPTLSRLSHIAVFVCSLRTAIFKLIILKYALPRHIRKLYQTQKKKFCLLFFFKYFCYLFFFPSFFKESLLHKLTLLFARPRNGNSSVHNTTPNLPQKCCNKLL